MSTMMREVGVSLSSLVEWTQVFTALGLPAPTSTLPVQAACPFCQRLTLRILADARLKGQWYSCASCDSHGDMLEFAAKYWGISVPTAISKLQMLGLPLPPKRCTPERVARYMDLHVEQRQQLLSFWHKSRKSFLRESVGLRQVLGRKLLSGDSRQPRWNSGMGQMLGSISQRQVQELHLITPARSYKPNELAQKRQLLAVPYWDQPARICGLLTFEQAPGLAKAQQQYSGVVHDQNMPREAGLAMHPAVAMAAIRWDRTCLATRDPLLMLQMQQRHLETASQPLPMVSWYQDTWHRTQNAWDLLGNVKLVLWAPQFDAPTLAQAMQRNAWIVDSHPSRPDGWDRWLGLFTPKAWLQRLCDAAIPWQEYWNDFVENASASTLDQLWQQWRQLGQSVELLWQATHPAQQQRLQELLKIETPPRALWVNKQQVVERQDGWYLQRNGQLTLICDAHLQIEEVVHNARRNKTFYRGQIMYKGEAIPFCAPQKEVTVKTGLWMQQQLLAANKGLLRYQTGWQEQFVQLALQWHPPQFTSTTDVVGWEPKQLRFVWPRFHVDAHGQVHLNEFPLVDEQTPAQQLQPGSHYTPIDWAQFTAPNQPGGELFWAMALATWLSATAPITGQVPPGIALAGHGAEQVARTASTVLGWYGPLRTKHHPEELREHHWPLLLESSCRRHISAVTNWLQQVVHPRYCAVIMLPNHAALYHLQGNWLQVVGENFTEVPPCLLQRGHGLLVGYMRDLGRRHWQLPLHGTDPLENLTLDVAQWVDRQGGRSEVILKAASCLRPDNVAARAQSFRELVVQQFIKRRVAFEREGYYRALRKLSLVARTGDRLFVPHQLLVEVAKPFGPLLDPQQVTELLQQANQWYGSESYENQPGWWIRESWWAAGLPQREPSGLRLHTDE